MSETLTIPGIDDPSIALALALQERALRMKRRRIATFFPDVGPLRRALYPKHTEFFAAGRTHRERLLLGGNRIGKSLVGGYELVLHLLGDYPPWWQGRRFAHPVRAWAAGDTAKTTRDILQAQLLGPQNDFGTGLIPHAALRGTVSKAGVPEAVELARVAHRSGAGESVLHFKSFDQGREAFQGTEQDVILLDEEAPASVYTECLLRTMPITGRTIDGLLMLTFTPLLGRSETVMAFLPDGEVPSGPQTGSKYVVLAGWDDVPHLTEEAKREMLAAMPPHQRDARSRGLPILGAGAIYPVPEADFIIDDFPIPPHWPRAYALDVGWSATAAIWGAYDRESDRWVLYHEYKVGQQEPALHARALQAPGSWIAGVIDPASQGSSQADGQTLMDQYRALGLTLSPADHAVEAGIFNTWDRLSAGRLQVFRSLTQLRAEMRTYQRDLRGKVVKVNDHLCDAMRYLVMSGLDVAKVHVSARTVRAPRMQGGPGSWMS